MTALPRYGLARAEHGPSVTLVIDGTELGVMSRVEAAKLVIAVVEVLRLDDARVGRKNVLVLRPVAGVVPLVFVQGLADGSFDLASGVCVNSAAAALEMALAWGLIDTTAVMVAMGGLFFFMMRRGGPA